jgi:hypothetical protein
MIDVMNKLKEIVESGYDNEDIQRGIDAAATQKFDEESVMERGKQKKMKREDQKLDNDEQIEEEVVDEAEVAEEDAVEEDAVEEVHEDVEEDTSLADMLKLAGRSGVMGLSENNIIAESLELDEEEVEEELEDSNYEIIMGFINQWTEAGQPADYMDDLIAYVKKTIPDSKDWKYAASLIKNGVKSYQDREYGTRNNTESVETTTTPERYGQDFFRSVLDELDQNDAPGQAPAGTAGQTGSTGPRDMVARDANKLSPAQKKRRQSRISQDLAKLSAEKDQKERRQQEFHQDVVNRVHKALQGQTTVSEATQGPGVDAVMELIDMGVSKEDLFDQMMRDHSDDELMSFADDYRRTNDLLGDEEGDDSIDIDPDQDVSNVFQQSNY